MNLDLKRYQEAIAAGITALELPETPSNLYDPIRYFMTLGGKRMRPALCLIACEMIDGKMDAAIHPAIGVELFHNFTLIHDDIMDKAPVRRAKPTVHERWDQNIAILSGDALFVVACQQIMKANPDVSGALMDVFHRTALEVCEGQQMDMDFESRSDVGFSEYLEMIRLKTAVLLGCSLKMGAIIAKAPNQVGNDLYDFGVSLGIAFQMQDDILDAYGVSEKVGKQTGGDIISGKKTFLVMKALEEGSDDQNDTLSGLLEGSGSEKVSNVLEHFSGLQVKEKVQEDMESWYHKAMSSLDNIDGQGYDTTYLRSLGNFLMNRDH